MSLTSLRGRYRGGVTLPIAETLVHYADGALTSDGTVVHVGSTQDGRLAAVLDTTAAHPVDAAWPDQGADRGTLEISGRSIHLDDCVVGATDGDAVFYGADVPVKKGTEGWTFFVAHIVSPDEQVSVGDSVRVTIDDGYRAAVSAGHTGCHLASLALNLALAPGWSKEVMVDAAGSPNFDALAIDSSTITKFASVDVYRLGKSLRRKGFAPAFLVDDLAAVQESINATLSEWAASDAAIRIEHEDNLLTGRRYWVAELPSGTVSIPCGGTHLTSLAQAAAIAVTLTVGDDNGNPTVRMETVVTPA